MTEASVAVADRHLNTNVTMFCVVCGKPFSPHYKKELSQVCCSAQCSGTYRKGRPHHRRRLYGKFDITCGYCKKVFKVEGNRRDTAKYCSKDCANAGRSTKEERTCQHCSATFRTHRCYTLRNGGKFCSRQCWKDSIESVFRTVKSSGRCTRCGWNTEPGILQIHHKDRDTANNTIENLELLCPNCHALEHFNAKDGWYNPSSVTNKNSHRARARRLREPTPDAAAASG